MITRPNVKINLGLNVLRKREDGFHDLETVFIPYFELRDVLEIIPGDGVSETSASLINRYGPVPEEVPDDFVPDFTQAISPDGKVMISIARREGVHWNPLDDICVKAYKVLDEAFRLPPVKIYLEKLSPVGAGLGGGSSDGAFALKMMNELFSLGLAEKELATFASRLGSDCPFFIYNRPMFGEGRGEKLSEFQFPFSLEDFDIQVITPENISVSTADAYKGIVQKIPSVGLREVLSRPPAEWKDLLANDFEKTVFEKHPQLAAIKQSLYDSGAVYASMSGSGSALFGIYKRDK